MNAVEIEQAVSELAEAPFNAATFPYDFLQAFGANDATIRKLKNGDTNKSDLPGGVLQRNKNNIHLLACPPGEVAAALAALRASPATAKHKARFILATDGQTLQAERFDDGEPLACDFKDLPNRFTFFLSLAGISTVKRIDENAFDIRATGRLNKLYVELLKENPDWDTEARRQDLNHFFARLIFCFFAEDTNIFVDSRLFTDTVEKMTERNGSNVHEVLAELFRAMDTKPEDRAGDRGSDIRPYALRFPYVNGNLFSGSTDTPRFNQSARNYLIFVGNLDWKRINPDIFGSMIQAVADDDERGALGMHYTSVPNILKVLNPLFLDDLRAKLEEAGDGKTPGSARKLLNLRNRLARIRVFDPACGSGNFLVIAYKEMRAIEAQINERRGESDLKSAIPISNFRGIELRHFPSEIARLMEFGNKPSDGGHLLIDVGELQTLNLNVDQLRRFTRRIYGSGDYIQGWFRHCIWIEDEYRDEAISISSLAERVEAVRTLRLASPDKGAHALAKRAHQLKLMRSGKVRTIIVPIHSSASRPYLPVGMLSTDCVITNAAYGLYDAPLWNMSLIASRIHLVWIGTICGKIKTDYRYSNTLGWNTFPVPTLTDQNKADLTRCAEDILLAREAHFPATIAELYDPEAMDTKYPDLRAAHERNDETLERIYIGRRFRNDTERLEKLFELYTQMTAKQVTAEKPTKRKVKGA